MEYNKIMVFGAGVMGSGIAQVCLTAGAQVVVCDTFAPALEKSEANMKKALAKLVSKGKMTQEAMDAALARLSYTSDVAAAKDAELIIEAIFENVEAKQDVFRKISEVCSDDAVLASNTSTISITKIGSAVKDASRFLGMHFFNPVPAMKLLEMIRGIETSEEVVERVKKFGEEIGKICILSKDSSGFIANRIGSPMMNAAANVFDSGIGSAADVDNAMKFGYGYPMGPLELIDLVGVDVEVAVMEVLYEEFGDPYYKPAPILKRMLAAGHLGRKTGKGFYEYK